MVRWNAGTEHVIDLAAKVKSRGAKNRNLVKGLPPMEESEQVDCFAPARPACSKRRFVQFAARPGRHYGHPGRKETHLTAVASAGRSGRMIVRSSQKGFTYCPARIICATHAA
jgi:hypothetical protein